MDDPAAHLPAALLRVMRQPGLVLRHGQAGGPGAARAGVAVAGVAIGCASAARCTVRQLVEEVIGTGRGAAPDDDAKRLRLAVFHGRLALEHIVDRDLPGLVAPRRLSHALYGVSTSYLRTPRFRAWSRAHPAEWDDLLRRARAASHEVLVGQFGWDDLPAAAAP